MGDGKKQIGIGLAIAAIVAVVALVGFALFKGTGKKEKPKDPATAPEYTQMRGMFNQMQQSGGRMQRPGYPPNVNPGMPPPPGR